MNEPTISPVLSLSLSLRGYLGLGLPPQPEQTRGGCVTMGWPLSYSGPGLLWKQGQQPLPVPQGHTRVTVVTSVPPEFPSGMLCPTSGGSEI